MSQKDTNEETKGEKLMDITELTVHELQEKIKNKELTITEINQAYVDRIKEKEPEVQAFITE